MFIHFHQLKYPLQ